MDCFSLTPDFRNNKKCLQVSFPSYLTASTALAGDGCTVPPVFLQLL